MEKEIISILGCGWLGLPLGKNLVGKGFQVKGSTTQPGKMETLSSAGIKPYQLIFGPKMETDPGDFFKCNLLILNLPPRNRNEQSDYHRTQLMEIKKLALESGVPKVLFISSTAVYPDLNRLVTEADALETSLSRGGIPLLKMEQLFTAEPAFSTTVIRMAGLFGPGRAPGRFLAGKKDVPGGNSRVNLIHLEDCIGIIDTIIKGNHWSEIFNACCPDHPTKEQFYKKAASMLNLDTPDFNSQPGGFKEVSPEYLIKRTGYQFKFPDPMEALSAC